MRSRVSLLSVAVLKLAGLNTTVPREGSSGLTPIWTRVPCFVDIDVSKAHLDI
jgi:hypothetical protein